MEIVVAQLLSSNIMSGCHFLKARHHYRNVQPALSKSLLSELLWAVFGDVRREMKRGGRVCTSHNALYIYKLVSLTGNLGWRRHAWHSIFLRRISKPISFFWLRGPIQSMIHWYIHANNICSMHIILILKCFNQLISV